MKNCKGCDKKIKNKTSNSQRYCTRDCREAYYNRTLVCRTKEYRDFKNHEKWNKYAKGKIKCLVCGGWYRAPLHHAWQRHALNEAEYKRAFGLDHKKGLITTELKAIKRDWVFANGTVNNLKRGKRTRFVKGDKRAGRYERSEQTMARLKRLSPHNNIQATLPRI